MCNAGGAGDERVWFDSWANVLEGSSLPPGTKVTHRAAIVQFLSASKKQRKPVNVHWAAAYLEAIRSNKPARYGECREALRWFFVTAKRVSAPVFTPKPATPPNVNGRQATASDPHQWVSVSVSGLKVFVYRNTVTQNGRETRMTNGAMEMTNDQLPVTKDCCWIGPGSVGISVHEWFKMARSERCASLMRRIRVHLCSSVVNPSSERATSALHRSNQRGSAQISG